MSTVNDYHTYARDCLRWAARARTEEQRKQFLSLASDWTHAAAGLEGVLGSEVLQTQEERPGKSDVDTDGRSGVKPGGVFLVRGQSR